MSALVSGLGRICSRGTLLPWSSWVTKGLLAGMLELTLGRAPPGGDLRLGATEEVLEGGTGAPTAPAWAPGPAGGREDTRGEGALLLARSEPVPPEAVGAPGVPLAPLGPFPAARGPRARAGGAVPAQSPVPVCGDPGVAPVPFPIAGAAAGPGARGATGAPGCSCAPGGWRGAPGSAWLSTWERGPGPWGRNLLEPPPLPVPASSSAFAPAAVCVAPPGSLPSPPLPGGLPPPGPGPGTAPPAEAAAAAAAAL